MLCFFFFFQAEDGIRDVAVTGVQTCALPISQGRVAHPQTQGKIERFWRTLSHEVLRKHSYVDQYSWQQCFDEWRYVYNHIRPHQAISDQTPSQLYLRSLHAY